MTNIDNQIVERITALARGVLMHPKEFGVLSTGEKIAVALVLEKPKLLSSNGWTILEAVNRLGPDWLAAALKVQREGF